MMTPLLLALLPALAVAIHPSSLHKHYVTDSSYVADPAFKYVSTMPSGFPLVKAFPVLANHPSFKFAKLDSDMLYPSSEMAYLPSTKFVSTMDFIPSEKYFTPAAEKYLPAKKYFILPAEKHLSTEKYFSPAAEKYLPAEKFFLPSEKIFLPAATEKYLPSEKIFLPAATEKYLPSEKIFLPAATEKYLPSEKFIPADKWIAAEKYLPSEKFITADEKLIPFEKFIPAEKVFTPERSFPAEKWVPVEEVVPSVYPAFSSSVRKLISPEKLIPVAIHPSMLNKIFTSSAESNLYPTKKFIPVSSLTSTDLNEPIYEH